jgi:hypothetical protein
MSVSARTVSNEDIQSFLRDPRSYLEACANAYTNTRYLRHVHGEGLTRRANDIGGNLWSTDASGMVVQLSEPARRELFMRLYAELEEERRLQSGGQVIDLDEGAIRAKASAAYVAPQLTSATLILAADVLVRF